MYSATILLGNLGRRTVRGQGSGFRVLALGFKWFRVQGPGFRVLALRFKWFRVQGLEILV